MVKLMKELVQIAQNVVKAVSKDLPFAISLSDENGYIVGATDPKRIGTFHPVSKKVVESNSFLPFSESDVVNFENVLPGIAVPLNFHKKTIGVLGIIGPPEKVKPHAEFTKRYVELMWRETFYKQIESLESKMKETYLQYILLNDVKSDSRLIQCCEALNLNVEAKSFCIIIELGNYLLEKFDDTEYSITVNNLRMLILRDIENTYRNKNTSIISFINTEKIIILQSVLSVNEYFEFMNHFKSKSENLIKRFAKRGINNMSISAGKLSSSLKTIHESYQEANYLIQNSENLKKQPVLSYYDWDVLTDLLPIKIDKSFKENITFRLEQLISETNFIELKNSFIAFCENGMNISEAAKSLFIHRNTLIYRLKKIEETLLIQTRNFQHCMLLYLVLKNL